MRALRPTIGAGEKIRVLVVDDSVVIRAMISRILEADAAMQVVGVARNGVDALHKVQLLHPHVVTLDVEMPELDGLGALRRIMEVHPEMRVIMLSSLTAQGAHVTVEALIAGASDYVTKPQPGDDFERAFLNLGRELVGKIKELFSPEELLVPVTAAAPGVNAPGVSMPSVSARAGQAAEIVAIGVSTGGPAALAEVLPLIPANFPLPIAIVQHMPPHFTKLLAQRLTTLSQIPVREGEEGMVAEPGCAILAPGGFHMRLVRAGTQLKVKLDTGPQENSCRPAVDVLFRSLAESCQGRVIAAVLTGMGQDGLVGARILKSLGASVIAQDQATSVIWGMPGAIVTADLADAVLPLKRIIPEILMRARLR